MLTLITCTGDRPEAFALCERWMARQDYDEPYQWIVVDDGREPTVPAMDQQYVRRDPPREKAPDNERMPASLKAAMPLARGDGILFIEDDDWYGPNYLAACEQRFAEADLIGEVPGRYYHVGAGLWRTWSRPPPHNLSPLSSTGLRRDAIPKLPAYWLDIACPFVDVRLWLSWDALSRAAFPCGNVAGMKGMPGRPGLSAGHNRDAEDWRRDDDGSVLRAWVGDDADVYLKYRERI